MLRSHYFLASVELVRFDRGFKITDFKVVSSYFKHTRSRQNTHGNSVANVGQAMHTRMAAYI